METTQQHDLAQHVDDSEYVEFFSAGTRATGVFQCVSCQVVLPVRGELGQCPVCGERLWERADWSPFGTRV